MRMGLVRVTIMVSGFAMVLAPHAEATTKHRFGLGLDLWGQQEDRFAVESEPQVQPAIDLLWEAAWPVSPQESSSVGLGAELLLPRTTDSEWDNTTYSYLTLYAAGRWHPAASGRAYLVARLGVALHRVTNGWSEIEPADGAVSATWGVGAGLDLSSHWSAELYLGHIAGDHPEGRFSRQLNAYDRVAVQLWYRP